MSTAQLVQLNMRVDAQDKAQAVEVLRLMGLTVSDLVRAVLAKVAQGAADCEQLMTALEEPETGAYGPPQEMSLNPALVSHDSIVGDLCRIVGYESPDDVPKDDRPWEALREEARLAHYREKGWLS